MNFEIVFLLAIRVILAVHHSESFVFVWYHHGMIAQFAVGVRAKLSITITRNNCLMGSNFNPICFSSAAEALLKSAMELSDESAGRLSTEGEPAPGGPAYDAIGRSRWKSNTPSIPVLSTMGTALRP
jgi:hypothetical protein